MYRLILYYLIILILYGALISLFGLVPFSALSLILSALILIAVSWSTNTLFAKVFNVPTNIESVFITALILCLIITPVQKLADLPLLIWVAVIANASKYILVIKKKHLFNPAAIAAVIVFLVGIGSASWWVGTISMLPVVVLGGILIAKKIQRFDLVLSFLLTSLVIILGFGILRGVPLGVLLRQILVDSPIIFFATIMLTEPLTSPPTKILRIYYGLLVGVLFNPNLNLLGFTSTPELALVLGNIFSYIVSPKKKLILTLKKRTLIAKDTDELVFTGEKMNFKAGQYLEWTLGHSKPDTRGNRRYFTLASSPTEEDYKFGIKFYEPPSSFKTALGFIKVGGKILAGQLSGEFTMPDDKSQKLCFIAGGIGVTPFRSMIKYLLDQKEKRDITLFYANNSKEEICFRNIFDQAEKELGIKIVYQIGLLTQDIIKKEISDFRDRLFYISGPHSMIDAFEKILKDMGLKGSQIKTDFFPGYA